MDIYVFCLSRHEMENTDGLLSMWRGYGKNGNGAAIVFDSGKLAYKEGSPLIISKVSYASKEERYTWIQKTLANFQGILSNIDVPTDKLYLAAWYILTRLKAFALFSKHHGFKEENEWRVAYIKEWDRDSKFTSMLHYSVSDRGVEPRLKLKIQPNEGMTEPDVNLDKLVHQIILGPQYSTELARSSVARMLETIGKADMVNRLKCSTTPYRSA